MVKIILLVLLAVTCVIAKNPKFKYHTEYEKFVVKHNKDHTKLDVQEIERRQNIYLKHRAEHEAHNADPAKTFTVGDTPFSDREPSENIKKLCHEPMRLPTTRSLPRPPAEPAVPDAHPASMTPPPLFDYCFSCPHPVQSQGGCGSCWSFATVAMLECWHAFYNTTWKHKLSEQFLVDCLPSSQWGLGCNGGWPHYALAYVRDTKKMQFPTLASYPYIDEQSTCKTNVTNIPMQFKSLEQLSNSNEATLMDRLWKRGPVVLDIEVPMVDAFFSYTGGVFTGAGSCTNSCFNINHAVVLTGWGYDKATNLNYWVIRNSWGTGWGINGYMKIVRNSNACGIACYIVSINNV